MKCPYCGTLTDSQSKFCTKCKLFLKRIFNPLDKPAESQGDEMEKV